METGNTHTRIHTLPSLPTVFWSGSRESVGIFSLCAKCMMSHSNTHTCMHACMHAHSLKHNTHTLTFLMSFQIAKFLNSEDSSRAFWSNCIYSLINVLLWEINTCYHTHAGKYSRFLGKSSLGATMQGAHPCGGYVLSKYQFGFWDGLTFPVNLSVYTVTESRGKAFHVCGAVAPSCGLTEKWAPLDRKWQCVVHIPYGCNEADTILTQVSQYQLFMIKMHSTQQIATKDYFHYRVNAENELQRTLVWLDSNAGKCFETISTFNDSHRIWTDNPKLHQLSHRE